MTRRFVDKKRGVERRRRKPIIFLAVEGRNKTEKLYFQALNLDCGNKCTLNFAKGGKTDLPGMWKGLQELMKGAFNAADGDKAFCLCDADFDPVKQALIRDYKLANANDEARIIISNPSFEIWYLNHFHFSTHAFGTWQALKTELEKAIPGYEKGGDYYLEKLKANTSSALMNSAQQLDQVNGFDRPANLLIGNPGIEMAEIVLAILGI